MDTSDDTSPADESFFDRVGTAAAARNPSSAHNEHTGDRLAQPANAPEKPGSNGKPECWTGNGVFFAASGRTFPRLDPGVYNGVPTQSGIVLRKNNLAIDHLVDTGDDAAVSLIEEFQNFWAKKALFKEHGFLHKRGFLLWGPPGSGKTSLLHVMMREVIEKHQGLCVLIEHPGIATEALKMVRDIEPDRQIICIIEDIDAMIGRFGEDSLLGLLDGEAQIDNVSFVATTNYPEHLDARFVNRPSRFDVIKYIGMPTALARDNFLRAKAKGLSDAERAIWVERTDGFSMAHLKEVIVAVLCLGQDFTKVIERLENMRVKLSSKDGEPSFGAGTGFTSKSRRLH